ncbi:hypothetical protein DdX_11249 [Ditylenchus destructor]|uniref:Uncharacterized protein n=1 Tax=Ditylenchus destructor TaxID=166010 RepID=A0AAD4R4S1_9BILA|nr:hypothetical protein DdX_11249 [Ditylenchus destructor]
MQSVFLLVLVSLSMCHYTESIQITTSDAATVKYLTKELKGWGGKLRSDVKEIEWNLNEMADEFLNKETPEIDQQRSNNVMVVFYEATVGGHATMDGVFTRAIESSPAVGKLFFQEKIKPHLKSNGGKLNVGAAYLKNNRVAPEGIDHPPAAHEWMHWYRIVVVASVAPPAYGN